MKKTIELDTVDKKEETNEELVKVEKVDDTPFTIIETDGKYFLALGKYRLTEPSEDREAVLDSVNDTSWHRLLSMMHAVAEEVYNNKKEE